MPRMTARRPRATTRRAARPRQQPEEAIQIQVVAHLRKHGIRFFHVPNGSKATARYRAKLWSMGLEAGVPDIVIVTPPRTPPHYTSAVAVRNGVLALSVAPCGAALELKADKGRVSDEQKQWLADLGALGWATAVTYGLDQALAQLRAWGYLPPATKSAATTTRTT